MGESGSLIISNMGRTKVLRPKAVASFVSISVAKRDIRDTYSTVSKISLREQVAALNEQFLSELLIALEQLDNEEGVNQTIINSERDAMCISEAMGSVSGP